MISGYWGPVYFGADKGDCRHNFFHRLPVCDWENNSVINKNQEDILGSSSPFGNLKQGSAI
jgi:hypothetical protein